jgi:Yip1 domain
MDFSKIIARVTAVLSTPKTEWPVIAGETTDVAGLYKNYILILAAVPVVVGFLKSTVIGYGVPFLGTFRVSVGTAIGSALVGYVLSLASVFLMALLVDALAPSFGGQKNQIQAMKTVAYSGTAAWVAGIGQIVPWLSLLILLAGGIYSIYLLYVGLPHTMKCPPDKAVGYTAVTVIVAIVLSWIIGMVVGGMTGMGAMMNGAGHPRLGSVDGDDSSVTFDKDSALGKLAEIGKRAEQANQQMAAAQKSGDKGAEAAAAGAVLGAVLGGGTQVEALAPDRLKPFIPETLAGMKRTEMSVERNGAMGMQVSEAHASYGDGQGRSVRLEITDMGSAKGFLSLASWAAVEQEKQTDHGYDRTVKTGGRIIHEQWDTQSNSGEYAAILGERFSVKVDGSAANIDELKGAFASINLAGLEALKNEGVKK